MRLEKNLSGFSQVNELEEILRLLLRKFELIVDFSNGRELIVSPENLTRLTWM
ncbi:hypothetical protein [Okeania sp. KiyG1]|uniref:hypothetical protein n=1 Tax=Okeania sp. KiyG1 TaxID=2720165 RepID=UPI0019232BBA|nr:hypothetical protein [Okeania sp. KiyG1]